MDPAPLTDIRPNFTVVISGDSIRSGAALVQYPGQLEGGLALEDGVPLTFRKRALGELQTTLIGLVPPSRQEAVGLMKSVVSRFIDGAVGRGELFRHPPGSDQWVYITKA